jgi:hypothetical protein
MGELSVSTAVRIRFPREMLESIEAWAAARDMPRSKAVRKLILQGLMDRQCDCPDGLDTCTGNCMR